MSSSRRWSWPILVAALLLVPAAPASAVGACDTRKTAAARADPARTVRAPLIVGDSTMLLATPYLGRLGIEADARGCRQFEKGVDLLAARRRAGTLPTVAIIALGSNGAISASQIKRARRLVGARGVLGLLTPARVGSGSTRDLRAAARRLPDRVVLIDWMRHSRGHGGWFGGDGLHVTDTGARAFAGFVRRRLAPFFPPRNLRVPVTPKGAKTCGDLRRGGQTLGVYVVRGRSRVSCSRARQLVRARGLKGVRGWRYYDWQRSGRRPWSAVYARADRRIVVAALPSPRASR